jgi:hypothetical protein
MQIYKIISWWRYLLAFPKHFDDRCANQARGGGGGMDLNWPASSYSQSVYDCIKCIDGNKVVDRS